MRTTSPASQLALVLSLSAAGLLSCSAEEPEESTAVRALGDCDTDWVCGSNSPEVDTYGFHELHLEGEPNREKAQIETDNGLAKIVKNGKTYVLKVIGSKIYGVQRGTTVLYDAGLVGAEIPLLIDGKSYQLRIETARDIRYAVGSQTEVLGAYTLSWYDQSRPANGKRTICAAPTILSAAATATKATASDAGSNIIVRPPPGGDELLGMRSGESVVFEGDRFDARAMTTAEVGDALWFNLGCAGHTLAKLHLTRNTIAGGAASYGISGKDRQATLKMMAADYCGDGTKFTVAGEPLRWRGGLVDFYTFPSSLEARWTNEGATCLNEPRLRHTTSTLAPQIFGPSIDAAIAAHCAIPKCSDLDVTHFEGASRVSGNP